VQRQARNKRAAEQALMTTILPTGQVSAEELLAMTCRLRQFPEMRVRLELSKQVLT
jgi:uncharacterized protein YceH (UPF0502 family)